MGTEYEFHGSTARETGSRESSSSVVSAVASIVRDRPERGSPRHGRVHALVDAGTEVGTRRRERGQGPAAGSLLVTVRTSALVSISSLCGSAITVTAQITNIARLCRSLHRAAVGGASPAVSVAGTGHHNSDRVRILADGRP